MIERNLSLPKPGTETFFLWGPRQTGKTTLLRSRFPDALWVDLLKSDLFRRYSQNPELLRQEIAAIDGCSFVVIDEIQKVPQLLNEVHWLHENRGVRFALCGSSARKVRRGQANLLGGRALRFELLGLSWYELGEHFSLEDMLNAGYLPGILLKSRPAQRLAAYVGDYLKEEIAAEGLVRNLPVFSEFLNIAALSDTEHVNFSTIARDCGVSSQTIRGYFQILEDTLLGSWLPAWRLRPKRRLSTSPKFYFSDVGVVNFLARRGQVLPGSDNFGKAFENWCHHELRAYNTCLDLPVELSHWRTAGGIEVDFIVGAMDIAIETKAVSKVRSHHLKGLKRLVEDFPEVRRRILVCHEETPRITPEGIEILPATAFLDQLWSGRAF